MEGVEKHPQSVQDEQRTERPHSSIRTRIEEATARILDGINAADATELERYLAAAARFPSLSLYNQHLLYLQCPDASYICRYETWQEYHYAIRRGQKAIRFLEGDQPITVFDRTQVIPRENATDPAALLPDPPDPHEVYERLIERLDAVELDWAQDGTRAALPKDTPLVRLQAELAYLVAGYADHLLHSEPLGAISHERFWDCHVEAITYCVLAHLGITTQIPGSDLVHWGNTPAALRQELEAVRRVTLRVLQDITPLSYAHKTPAEPIRQRQYPL